jgi:Ca-activated chloride channel family protein
MDVDAEKNYYAILGVSSFATPDEIKQAYRRLARRYHPDSRDADTPTSLFHQVQEAYAVLSDASSRRAYDRRRDELGKGDGVALASDVLLSRELLYSEHEEQVFYVMLEIGAAAASGDERLPVDLSVVIDRSTSMEGARLENVKEAARQIVDQLHDGDTLTLVSFNDRAEVILSDEVGSSRAQAKAAITALRAEGGTELLRGIRAGLEKVGMYKGKDVVSHLILLTDGRTYGDDEACVAAAEKAGQRGITITAMGIGEDWNDDLLDDIASRSGGASAYIASPGQVRALLRKKVRSLGSVFATGLTLTVRSAEGVRVEAAFQTSPTLERLHLSDGTTRLGSLSVDAPMRILLEVGIGRRSPGEHRLLQIELNGDVPYLDRPDQRLKRDVWCTFTDDERNRGEEEVPSTILSALSRVTLYRMQEQAWSALEEGRIDRATSQLEMVATRLLDMGEEQLAQAAMLEAENIARRGTSTSLGRKRIKYGTRSMDIGRKKK